MNKIQTWISTNKVLLFGMLGAIGVVLEQYTNEVNPDYKVIAFGVGIGILSFLAKNLRGQWGSIIGMLGTSLATVATAVESGNKVSWFQVITSLLIAMTGIVAPPAKSLSYEQSPVVEKAKDQAATIDAGKEPPVSPPVTSK